MSNKVSPESVSGSDTASMTAASESQQKEATGSVSVVGGENSVEGGPPKREQWGNTIDFILSCIGYAVGFGNLTRFPYICGRNGGAAFLIPYVIMLICTGLPMFFLELSIGQFAQVTPLTLYKRMCPVFRGLGQTMVAIAIFTCIYYNVQMAWSLVYLWDSIYYPIAGEELPFKGCTHSFNSEQCFDYDTVMKCDWNNTERYRFGTCVNSSSLNSTEQEHFSDVTWLMVFNGTGNLPAQEYNDYVLGYNRNTTMAFQTFGAPQLSISIGLVISWILLFLVLFKGVKMSGKVVYFTATAPYFLLVVLLIVGNTLEGAGDGISFYMVPKWDKLNSAQPWIDAASQIFFSLSVGGGGLTTLASYNNFHNNLMRDTLIVVLGNCATSVFAGFVIFPILGYEANRLYKYTFADPYDRVSKIASAGPALAFIAYPGALSTLPLAWLWSFVFFFMLLLLGIDSELVMVEVVITAILDQNPYWRQKYKTHVTALVCFCGLLCGLVLATPAGIEIYNLLDTFAGGWTLTLACMVEVIYVAWIYDIRRFIADLRLMLGVPKTKLWKVLGYPVNPYWILCWTVLTPLILLGINIVSFMQYKLTYDGKSYPAWGEALGFGITGLCMIWVPGLALWMVFQAMCGGKGWQWLIRPSNDYGPSIKEDREEVEKHHPYHRGVDSMFGHAVAYSYNREGVLPTAPIYEVDALDVKKLKAMD